MIKWVVGLSIIVVLVGAEVFLNHWLPRHSLSYQILTYRQAQSLNRNEWSGFSGQVFFNAEGFSDQDWNRAEYASPEKYRVGVFGGWMGLGLTSSTAQSFTEVYRQSVLTKSAAHPPGQKLFLFNFSQGGLCLKDLTDSIRGQIKKYALDAVVVLITPDVFSPCDAKKESFRWWMKSALLFSLVDGLGLYHPSNDPRVDLVPHMSGQETLHSLRDEFLNWSFGVSKQLNVDIVPVIVPWPGSAEDSGYWGLAIEREFEIAGITPISLTRDPELQGLSLFQDIYMLDYPTTQTVVESLIRNMYVRGWRQDLKNQR